MSDEKELKQAPQIRDTGHEYDGIRELDNDLPRWWLWLFYLSILFSVPYVAYYHLFDGPTLNEIHDGEMKAKRLAALAQPKSEPAFDEAAIIDLVRDPAALAVGKTAFTAKCSSCHGVVGEGGIGPNLTDDYWLHGGKPSQIAQTVDKGVLEKGMPSWRPMMSPEEILRVTAFIQSIRGSNPPGAKGSQGKLEKQ